MPVSFLVHSYLMRRKICQTDDGNRRFRLCQCCGDSLEIICFQHTLPHVDRQVKASPVFLLHVGYSSIFFPNPWALKSAQKIRRHHFSSRVGWSMLGYDRS
jgi:hypothetical protein